VNSDARPSRSRSFKEFNCRRCGAHEAYQSRPRGFFEKYVLPLLLMQTVRCERCDRRFYVRRAILALERVQLDRKQTRSQSSSDSKPDSRVA
jgi:hypothetical protein